MVPCGVRLARHTAVFGVPGVRGLLWAYFRFRFVLAVSSGTSSMYFEVHAHLGHH